MDFIKGLLDEALMTGKPSQKEVEKFSAKVHDTQNKIWHDGKDKPKDKTTLDLIDNDELSGYRDSDIDNNNYNAYIKVPVGNGGEYNIAHYKISLDIEEGSDFSNTGLDRLLSRIEDVLNRESSTADSEYDDYMDRYNELDERQSELQEEIDSLTEKWEALEDEESESDEYHNLKKKIETLEGEVRDIESEKDEAYSDAVSAKELRDNIDNVVNDLNSAIRYEVLDDIESALNDAEEYIGRMRDLLDAQEIIKKVRNSGNNCTISFNFEHFLVKHDDGGAYLWVTEYGKNNTKATKLPISGFKNLKKDSGDDIDAAFENDPDRPYFLDIKEARAYGFVLSKAQIIESMRNSEISFGYDFDPNNADEVASFGGNTIDASKYVSIVNEIVNLIHEYTGTTANTNELNDVGDIINQFIGNIEGGKQKEVRLILTHLTGSLDIGKDIKAFIEKLSNVESLDSVTKKIDSELIPILAEHIKDSWFIGMAETRRFDGYKLPTITDNRFHVSNIMKSSYDDQALMHYNKQFVHGVANVHKSDAETETKNLVSQNHKKNEYSMSVMKWVMQVSSDLKQLTITEWFSKHGKAVIEMFDHISKNDMGHLLLDAEGQGSYKQLVYSDVIILLKRIHELAKPSDIKSIVCLGYLWMLLIYHSNAFSLLSRPAPDNALALGFGGILDIYADSCPLFPAVSKPNLVLAKFIADIGNNSVNLVLNNKYEQFAKRAATDIDHLKFKKGMNRFDWGEDHDGSFEWEDTHGGVSGSLANGGQHHHHKTELSDLDSEYTMNHENTISNHYRMSFYNHAAAHVVYMSDSDGFDYEKKTNPIHFVTDYIMGDKKNRFLLALVYGGFKSLFDTLFNDNLKDDAKKFIEHITKSSDTTFGLENLSGVLQRIAVKNEDDTSDIRKAFNVATNKFNYVKLEDISTTEFLGKMEKTYGLGQVDMIELFSAIMMGLSHVESEHGSISSLEFHGVTASRQKLYFNVIRGLAKAYDIDVSFDSDKVYFGGDTNVETFMDKASEVHHVALDREKKQKEVDRQKQLHDAPEFNLDD